MKVTTIDGGFRGLGSLRALSTDQQINEAQPLSRAADQANAALERATLAATRGALTSSELSALRNEHTQLLSRVEAHLVAMNGVVGEANLAEWRSTARVIASDLAAFRTRALRAAGETTLEPWKMGLAVVGGLALVGGIAWVVSR